ncbi:MAG: hypothetical protein B7Y68_08890 [Thiotrichales bacterium 35-46-9]|nr:MAG: hypothetical protein B7Y68_08890 [Thiotrichales bacterium 35-46-9]
MTIEMLLDKSDRALASAQLLFSAGDYEGACNRAYYAMFDAAKAALIHAQPDDDLSVAKTHNGLIVNTEVNLTPFTLKTPIEN